MVNENEIMTLITLIIFKVAYGRALGKLEHKIIYKQTLERYYDVVGGYYDILTTTYGSFLVLVCFLRMSYRLVKY